VVLIVDVVVRWLSIRSRRGLRSVCIGDKEIAYEGDLATSFGQRELLNLEVESRRVLSGGHHREVRLGELHLHAPQLRVLIFDNDVIPMTVEFSGEERRRGFWVNKQHEMDRVKDLVHIRGHYASAERFPGDLDLDLPSFLDDALVSALKNILDLDSSKLHITVQSGRCRLRIDLYFNAHLGKEIRLL